VRTSLAVCGIADAVCGTAEAEIARAEVGAA
jgi:hypothetical protein